MWVHAPQAYSDIGPKKGSIFVCTREVCAEGKAAIFSFQPPFGGSKHVHFEHLIIPQLTGLIVLASVPEMRGLGGPTGSVLVVPA